MTVWPYVRFTWVVSLGILDTFLVLVLLFWPESDYMCHQNSDTSSVPSHGAIGEVDVVTMIGMILLLHLCDVVCTLPFHLRIDEGFLILVRFVTATLNSDHARSRLKEYV